MNELERAERAIDGLNQATEMIEAILKIHDVLVGSLEDLSVRELLILSIIREAAKKEAA